MRARAVIGANFGDEGKGLITDYLCATQGAGMVVRFNGGAQAGHTVVTPDGKRHVFHHFGAGALAGVPTFLSQFFVINPILFFQELEELNALGLYPRVYAHPDCLITTYADMMINQRIEERLGAKRHGSCGVGINETIVRSQNPQLSITMSDLWSHRDLTPVLEEICGKYAAFRTGEQITLHGGSERFKYGCSRLANRISPLGIAQCKDPIFEGAQGLLLDQDNKDFFPHVTRSKTGLHNVKLLCQQAKIEHIDAYYVSRTYLTRHGAGPLPGEDATMRFEDQTNVPHPFQGELRFAQLDSDDTWRRSDADFGTAKGCKHFVYTHCDQVLPPRYPIVDYYSYGPTRNDVETERRR